MQPGLPLLLLVYFAISHVAIATDHEPLICEFPGLSTLSSMVQLPQSKPKGGDKYRPPGAPLDVEGYPVAPPELELEQVHIYVRHGTYITECSVQRRALTWCGAAGERTPVSVRLAEPPASIPERWLLCKQARRFRAAVAGSGSDQDERPGLEVNRILERSNGVSVEGEWCVLRLSVAASILNTSFL